ncbi:MAG: amidophosphoribosyltransferase, partial [Betaproteobacteria bacterium]|nr:amidophosphoribosyltransferase [Betaproteobacteria bacterium]
MCGIVGVVSNAPVNQLIYDALLLLQHRGQDAAGIVTQQERKFFMHKAKGMVRDVFRTRNMRSLPGNCGLGQVRYPTAGNAYSEEEAQPFYVNAPFGIVLVHNGNLTNAKALKAELFSTDHRHINTESDSEVRKVHRRVRGSYAVIALIAGHGVLAFRDPFGIRPLCLGRSEGTVVVASESVALEGTSHRFERNVAPGEAIFIDLNGTVHTQQCAEHPVLNPCIFEFVYLARPDSVMDGISVYQARLNLG